MLSLLSTGNKQLHLQNKPVHNFLEAVGGIIIESGIRFVEIVSI